MEEKPEYGWYVKGLIVNFSIIGVIGIFMLIFGLLIQDIIGLIFTFSGISIIILFLWPGVGIAMMNLILNSKFFSSIKMEALNEIKSPQILDVGCGTGRTAVKIAKMLKDGGHLFGIDVYKKIAISGNALETIQKNARLEKVENKTTFLFGSATEIPFEDNKFDIVNVSSVLHELHGEGAQDKALAEIFRVLKPNGYFYNSEWNRTSWQTIAYTGIFCLVFQKYSYWQELMKKHKFQDIKFEKTGGFVLFEARKQ